MKKSFFKVTPIGGVGQIGSNMTLFETKEKRILVDCGILFPFEDFFDINYLIPNTSDLGKLDAIVITHGHEDHIGAITHLVQQYPDVKIYSPAFAAELMRFKLNHRKMSAQIEIYTPNSCLEFGETKIYPIHVNHSIPQTFGLLFLHEKLDLATFFVSDFKVDPKASYEDIINLERLQSLSQSFAHRYLLADSTNILSSRKKTLSETDLVPAFEEIFAVEGRIFATCFSSNIHRIQTIVNAAAKTNRKVVLYGGSMVRYSSIAKGLDILKDPHDTLREPNQLSSDNSKLVVLCSGSQGEFKSTMTRVIRCEDSLYKPTHQDHFLFSSKAIPGNEKKLSLLFNLVSELGAKLYTDQTHQIHASGHPGQEDLTLLINSFKPTHMTPIHGESYFLEKHHDFILKTTPQTQVLAVRNHDSIIFQSSKFEIVKNEPLEPILIHGDHVEIERKNISERRKMACSGVIFITIGKKLPQPLVTFSGVTNAIDDKKSQFELVLAEYIKDLSRLKPDKATEEVRIFTRRYFGELIGQKPITFVHHIL